MDCLFCKIANGEIPSNKVYEDDKILAFRDIAPQADVHVLVIPKEHVASSANDVNAENCEIVGYIFAKIPEIAKKQVCMMVLILPPIPALRATS